MTADSARKTESPGGSEHPGGRDIEVSVEIAAPPAAVWRAISDGDAVACWFSPIASAEPGVGGHQTFSWGGGSEWTSWITAWEPPHHLRLVDRNPADGGTDPAEGGTDPAEGGADPAEGPSSEAGAMALDYRLTDLGGATRLDLVNSGLSTDPSWDEAFHMMQNGWRFFLWNLKHCVERHPGVRRTMISARPWVAGTRAEVWDRFFGADGLGAVPAEPGGPFSLRLDGGAALDGSAVLSDRPWAFAGRVESLDDGVLHVEMEGEGDRWKLGVWLSVYGLEEEKCKELGEALDRTVARIFPARG